jgi:hypothetical protein
MMSSRAPLAVVFVFFALSLPAFGQAVKGSIVGTVTDSSGAGIPDASVTVTEVQTGISRSVPTSQSGAYVASNLSAGTYSVTITHPGFRKFSRENVDVLVNTTIRVDMEMQPGSVNESIVVTSDAPVLQTDRADIGRKVETRQIVDMPLAFNRNFQGLLNLVPGVIRSVRIHSEFYNPQDSLSSRVNGQARQANNVQIEGVDNNFRNNRLTVMIPPIEALAAVDITTSNYEAELGRAGGAVTNVTLRSGTNELHGSLFEFNRVSRLAARNVFANTKAPVTYNQFGFTLGGPLVRNRTFWFGDHQGVRDRRGDLTQATLPDAAFRSGNLSASPTIIYDPATGTPDGRNRQPFPGNIIPDNRISPIARRILDLVPMPMITALNTNFQRSTVRKKDMNSFDVKLDHQFTPSSRISGRYSFQRAATEQPPVFGAAGGPSLGGGPAGTAGAATYQAHSGAVNLTQVFTPTLIGDFRVGVSRYTNNAQQSDYGSNAAAALGIPGVNISDYTTGMPQINIDGFSAPLVGYTNSLPWIRAETGYFYVGSVTKVAGNHTIKIGGEYRRQGDVADLPDTYGVRGGFNFAAGPTSLNGDPRTGFGNSFAAFLLDAPTRTQRELRGVVPHLEQNSIFSFLQDKWQIGPKLTVDLGIRHEVYLPPTPRHPGGFSNYDPQTNTLRLGGIGAIPSDTGVRTFLGGFAPRTGVSWRLNDLTVIRGGYGGSLFTPGAEVKGYYNYPVRQYFLTTGANSYVPAGSLASGFPVPLPLVFPSDGIIPNPPDAGIRFVSQDYRDARLQSWNVAVQRKLPGNFVFEAAYVGNHADRATVARDINAGLVPGAGIEGQPLYQKFGMRSPIVDDYYPTSTDYHSLQVKFDRRFAQGFLLTTAYTYGKAIDYSGDYGGLFINAIPELNRARSNDNPTHIFVQSYIWELPFGAGKPWLSRGVGRWILGGWQVNGILTLQSGLPLNITAPSAPLNAPGNGNRPNVNGKPEINGEVGVGQLWFDSSRFSAPAPATYGTVGRNILTGPGFANFDFSAFRKFAITERTGAELRFESFNLTNTPHFSNPNGSFGSAGFGQITSAQQDQRQVQLGLRVTF